MTILRGGYMSTLKLIWNNNGKHMYNSVTVSTRYDVSYGLSDVISPTDIKGTGSDFGSDLSDFAKQLDEYIAELCKFKNEVVRTKKAYFEAIEVDCNGNPIKE